MEPRRRVRSSWNVHFFIKVIRVCCLSYLILFVIPGLRFTFSERELVLKEQSKKIDYSKQATKVQFELCTRFSELRYICANIGATYRHGNYSGNYSNWKEQYKSFGDILSLMAILGYGFLLITRMGMFVLDNVAFGSHSNAARNLLWLLAIILAKASDFFLIYVAMVGTTFLEFLSRKIISPAMSNFEDNLAAPLVIFFAVFVAIWKLAQRLNITATRRG